MSPTPTVDDTFVVAPPDTGRRLVDVVRDRLAVVATRAVGPLVAAGGVLVDRRVGRMDDRTAVGERLSVVSSAWSHLVADGHVVPPADLDVPVRHADPAFVVVDKPAGMHVHPMGVHREATLLGAVLWYAGGRPDRPWAAWRPLPVHRLDRPTSGLVAFATDRDTARRLQDHLVAGRVTRTYEAVVEGRLGPDEGVVDAPLGRDPQDDYRRAVVADGRPARTRWEVTTRDADTTAVRIVLETGRTHQVRVHLASLGHPVVGDVLYGAASDPALGPHAIALRAVRLQLPHPTTGIALDIGTAGS